MKTAVYNRINQCEEPLEKALKEVKDSFENLKNHNATPEEFDGWRSGVREKYPFDGNRLLVALQEQLDIDRQKSA